MVPDPISILLADDDKDDCLLFQDALEELPLQTHLSVVNNGEQLMTYLHKEKETPTVLFLDLNMPRKSGLECLAEIRRIQKLKNIPVVIFSTSGSEIAIEKTYTLGATYFICKPRSYGLLKKAIETILSFDSGLLAQQPPKEEYFLQFA